MNLPRSVYINLFWIISLSSGALPAYAWDDHAVVTSIALSSLEKLNSAAKNPAESFESFLMAEQSKLPQLLETEEEWARKNIALYLPRPDSLKFTASKSPKEARIRFLQAIRVNPNSKLPLFLQQIPGKSDVPRQPLAPEEVTLLPNSLHPDANRFVSLNEKDAISPVDIITTASDEPDYGLNIDTWEDSETDFGSKYGFGKQPFGNPSVEFSSQAPFHMAFLHEAGLVYDFASYLSRDLLEASVHLYISLAQFSFAQGHPYWGWRFTGWALHYVQDGAQPWHATALPGLSVARMLVLNAFDLMGFHSWKDQAIQVVTNKHLALENYELRYLITSLENRNSSDQVIQALSGLDVDVSHLAPYENGYVRNVVTDESHSMASRADTVITSSIPSKLLDAKYLFGVTDRKVDVLQEMESRPQPAQDAMKTLLSDLMINVGKHSRNFVNSVLESVEIK